MTVPSLARTHRPAAAAALVAAVVVLAGCGGGGGTSDAAGSTSPSSAAASAGASPSASATAAEPEQPSIGELYTKVRETSLAAKSGHVSGDVTSGGQTVTVDIEGTADGKNQRAQVGIGKGEAEILTVKGKNYLTGDKAFWKEQTGDANAAGTLAGKYVVVSGKDAKGIGDFSLGTILKEMFADEELGALEKLTSDVETRQVKGESVWVASDKSGAEIWVDPKTSHLVKVVLKGKDAGTVDFTDWDSAQTFTAPAKGKIITF